MSTSTETLLNVEGMTCSSCVHHVEEALRDLEGVGSIQVKLADGTVRVQHNPSEASVAQMIQALGDAGYETRAA